MKDHQTRHRNHSVTNALKFRGDHAKRQLLRHIASHRDQARELVRLLVGDEANATDRLEARLDLLELAKWHYPMPRATGIRRSTITDEAQSLAEGYEDLVKRFNRLWSKFDTVEGWLNDYRHALFRPLDSSYLAKVANQLRANLQAARARQITDLQETAAAMTSYCEARIEQIGADIGRSDDLSMEMSGGNPRRRLAAEAALLYIRYRKDISSTIEGPFHQFFDALVEFISGKNPMTERHGTARQMKWAALKAKRIQSIEAEFRRRGQVPGPRYIGPDSYLREVDNELLRLHRELIPAPIVKDPVPRKPKRQRLATKRDRSRK